MFYKNNKVFFFGNARKFSAVISMSIQNANLVCSVGCINTRVQSVPLNYVYKFWTFDKNETFLQRSGATLVFI